MTPCQAFCLIPAGLPLPHRRRASKTRNPQLFIAPTLFHFQGLFHGSSLSSKCHSPPSKPQFLTSITATFVSPLKTNPKLIYNSISNCWTVKIKVLTLTTNSIISNDKLFTLHKFHIDTDSNLAIPKKPDWVNLPNAKLHIPGYITFRNEAGRGTVELFQLGLKANTVRMDSFASNCLLAVVRLPIRDGGAL